MAVDDLLHIKIASEGQISYIPSVETNSWMNVLNGIIFFF